MVTAVLLTGVSSSQVQTPEVSGVARKRSGALRFNASKAPVASKNFKKIFKKVLTHFSAFS
jgi:hypothetical protein